MKITAIILAGGLSRRMGRNKLNLLIDNTTMLERVLDTAGDAGFCEIILVRSQGTQPPRIPKDSGSAKSFLEILNPSPEEGIAGSIRLGLTASHEEAEGWVFLMADQPFLTSETLRQLAHRFKENPNKIIQPVYGMRKGGPVFFPRHLKAELMELTGDIGGRQVMARHPELILREFFPLTREALDLDEPQDYEALAGRKRVLVKGAGDLATGVLQALYQAGYEVLALERAKPSCIRREVSFASAIFEGTKTIEGITAGKAESLDQAMALLKENKIPILIDPRLDYLASIRPDVLVDAVIAKSNTGTSLDMAPRVIALGPGFTVGVDCHALIETMRGDTLAKVYTEQGQKALPNTGTPGLVGGEDILRVIHAPASGILHGVHAIGDLVAKNEVIALIGETEVRSLLDGTLRGLIQDGYRVKQGLKIADVDPRHDPSLAFAISDKAKALGQAVIEAITTLSKVPTRE